MQKHKDADKRMSDFFPFRCYLWAFLFLFVLFVRVKSFCKKKKKLNKEV